VIGTANGLLGGSEWLFAAAMIGGGDIALVVLGCGVTETISGEWTALATFTPPMIKSVLCEMYRVMGVNIHSGAGHRVNQGSTSLYLLQNASIYFHIQIA
jgi:hypothetical protein